MKKNGFTLIELIGTLLLLGLLFVFITSNVISSIEDSKKAAANASTENLIDALEQYYYERKMAGTFEPCSYNFSTNVNTCEGFIFDGKKPSRGVVSIDLDGAVSGNVDFGYYVAIISDGSIIIPEDLNQYIGTEYVFNYTGNEQTFTVPYSGFYKLEVWGAQGGSYDTTYIGGYGSYSVGTVNLNKDDVLYINVGGAGSSGLEIKQGGYNGGGLSYGGNCNGGTNRYGASGGGATHIATASGVLSAFDANHNGTGETNEIAPILIVAGGGGGSHKMAYAYGSGASGGGYVGNTSTWTNGSHTYYVQPTGGTQTAGGLKGYSYSETTRTSASFGKGLDYDSLGDGCDCGSGGGGGFYGGGSGQFAPGGGGSGYIGNVFLTDKAMYCYQCSESSDVGTKTVSTNNVSSTPTSGSAKSGNGYAKITYMGPGSTGSYALEEYAFNYTGDDQEFTVPHTGYYKLEVWGAAGGDADSTHIGGLGGYASEVIKFNSNEVLHIAVGGKGTTCSSSNSTCSGGYNGGGSGKAYSNFDSTAAGGGGATHIATAAGLLSSFDTNSNGIGDSNEISSILIVAGGGGGGIFTNGDNNGIGGSGGGTSGLAPTNCTFDILNNYTRYAIPGNQSSGVCTDDNYNCSSFGHGGDSNNTTMHSAAGSGGGAGYYGGSGANIGPGAGGSSYTLSNSLSALSIAGGTLGANMPTYDGSSTMTGNSGNGYAKISYLGTSYFESSTVGSEQTQYAFNYTDGEQAFTVPYSGYYKLEVWGAQGGDANSTHVGGNGGYASEILHFNPYDLLYVNVGGKGSTCVGANVTCKGGYNGGGSGKAYQDSYSLAAGGGGATHIATTSGRLFHFDTNGNGIADSNEISSLLIVAGGGGGGHYTNDGNYGIGGTGGGTSGLAPTNCAADTLATGSRLAIPGTQSSNACTSDNLNCSSFGLGGSSDNSSLHNGAGSGGGAGYYGGSGANIGPGAGGSSYTLSSGIAVSNIAGNQSVPAHTGTGTITGNSGNGYARITYIGTNYSS